MKDRHASKVARVAAHLRARKSSRPLSFKKRAVSHQVPKRNLASDDGDVLDVSDFDQILSIDVDARTCTAEPGVTFVDLVRATLRHGLVPIIVPELETITIGGAVSGCSLESMSFKYGGFHDTCLEYEVVTANGEVLTCTPENEHSLVFQMIHGSFGTLGLLTKLTFKLVPARNFVHVVYEKHSTLEAYKAAIQRRYESGDVDFMDGFVHAPDRYVLSLGRFVDAAPYTNRYDWTKVYYLSTETRAEDYLRTPHYFFRYDHGVTNVHPKSAIGRLFFGPFMGSTSLLKFANRFRRFLPVKSPGVTLDVFIPFSKMDAFLEWYRKDIGYYPLWCVPYRRVRDYEWIAPRMFDGIGDGLFVDLAIYGLKQPPGRNLYRELELALERVQGIKTLISYNYYSEDEFWRIWNRPNYSAVKARTDPKNVFRDLYEKTCAIRRG